jgi:hypothetical protein
MRLLPRPEIKKIKNEETQRLVKERAALGEAVNVEIREFNSLKEDMEMKRNVMLRNFSIEMDELNNALNKSKAEVVALEERRKRAMKGVSNEMEAARVVREEVDKNLLEAKKTVDELQAKRNVLDNEKLELDAKKNDLDSRQAVVEYAEEKFSNQKKSVMETLDKREKKIIEKEKGLSAQEKKLEERSSVVRLDKEMTDILKETCDRMERELKKREEKLVFKEQMLENAWKEAKKKKIV